MEWIVFSMWVPYVFTFFTLLIFGYVFQMFSHTRIVASRFFFFGLWRRPDNRTIFCMPCNTFIVFRTHAFLHFGLWGRITFAGRASAITYSRWRHTTLLLGFLGGFEGDDATVPNIYKRNVVFTVMSDSELGHTFVLGVTLGSLGFY